MSSSNIRRAAFGLALTAIATVAGVAFAQDGANAGQKKGPVSVRAARPFVRAETPANQAPNLYDASSDEFNYFREDLGRQELSSKQKARLEQLASRVVYADPMDKPAADGSKFIDIYSLDEVIADGKAFEGLDDPDFIYKDCEHNVIAEFAESCDTASEILSLVGGVSSSTDQRNGSGYGSGYSSGSAGGPGMPMPTVTMGPVMMEDGKTAGGPGADSKSAEAAPAKSVEPSANDDSALIFPGDPVENPFDGSVEAVAEEFDFFKADREFAPKSAPDPKNAMEGSMGGPMGK